MLDNDKPLDEVRAWAKTKKDELRIIREFKNTVKQKLNEFIESGRQKEHERMIYEQKDMLEEQSKMNRAEQQQRGEERARQQKQEEDWFQKRFELEMELVKKRSEDVSAKLQAVKLQKYTITPFEGDYRDWLRFWNQFTVEVDNSGISKISKFNIYLS